MCVRRFLLVVFFLTLLVVAAAFGIYQFGGSVLVKQAQPEGRFEAPPAGGGPDYVQTSNWISLPDTVPAGPGDWLPSGAVVQVLAERTAPGQLVPAAVAALLLAYTVAMVAAGAAVDRVREL